VGTRGYLTAGADLHILDLTWPAAPVLLDLLQTGDFLLAVRAQDDYAYVGGLYDRLRVVDLSISPPGESIVVTGGSTVGLVLDGAWLYAAADTRGLEGYDVSTPGAPVLRTALDTSGHAVDVAVQGANVSVAAKDGQLWTIENDVYSLGCSASAVVSPAGPLTVCVGDGALLDATASVVSSCASAPGFEWREDGVPIAGATTGTYAIPAAHAAGSFVFTVSVSCPANPGCSGSTTVSVTIDPDLAPTVAPNTLVAVKVGAGATFSWLLGSGSGGFNLHRTTDKTALPALAGDGAALVQTTVTLTAGDTPPAAALQLYRVFGRRSCTGLSAP
jgi:hypothetical protein